MNRKFLFATALFLMAATAWSQEFKVGYTSIDAIVFSMPEVAQINADLKVYQQQLASQVQNKQTDIETKITEYENLAKQPNPAELVLQEKANEIRRMQSELQNFTQKADEAFTTKQSTSYNPVYTKVQNAIEEVRVEKGYAMILNARTDSGSGIVLAGRDEDNITEAIFAKLGVPMPKEPEAAKTGNGN